MDLKNSLREKIRAERDLLDKDKFYAENKLIVENINLIIDSLYYTLRDKDKTTGQSGIGGPRRAGFKKSIGLYSPLKGEPDLIELVDKDWAFGLPKIDGNQMEFVRYRKGMKLKKGAEGVKYPCSGTVLIPDIIIAPALAYCQEGYRLGFGSGYYDKYFSRYAINTSIIKIGVCFDKYLLKSLPIERHDIKFDYVITDKSILKL